MTVLNEGQLSCTFPAGWNATKYDDWAYYRNQFQGCCNGNKAVDFLGLEPDCKTLWLIELKDFRLIGRRIKDKDLPLWDEIALKVRDTLAGLIAAQADTSHADHAFAKKASRAGKLRIVLHLEQPSLHTKLRPRIFDLANVQQKIKQMVKPIDAHPCVIELATMNRVPWSAVGIP